MHFCHFPYRALIIEILIARALLVHSILFSVLEAELHKRLVHHPAIKMVFFGGLYIVLDSFHSTVSLCMK